MLTAILRDVRAAAPLSLTRATRGRGGGDDSDECVTRFTLLKTATKTVNHKTKTPKSDNTHTTQTHRKVEVLTHPQWKSRSGGFYVSERRKVPGLLRTPSVAITLWLNDMPEETLFRTKELWRNVEAATSTF